MSDNTKVVGLFGHRPINSDTLTPMSDEELCGKTYYFSKILKVTVALKAPIPSVEFEITGMKMTPCKFDREHTPIDTEYEMYGTTSKNFDSLSDEFKRIFEWDNNIVRFRARDVMYVKVYEMNRVTEEPVEPAIKIEYKKVKEVE